MLTDGAWLRRQREDRGWAGREMARRLIDAGHAAGDKAMPAIDSMAAYVRRWEHGKYSLTERYRLYYCAALGLDPSQFGQDRPALCTSRTVAYRGTYRPDPDGLTVEREVLMTAHESSDHAEQAGQAGIGEVTSSSCVPTSRGWPG